jgi:hypothetical protein
MERKVTKRNMATTPLPLFVCVLQVFHLLGVLLAPRARLTAGLQYTERQNVTGCLLECSDRVLLA